MEGGEKKKNNGKYILLGFTVIAAATATVYFYLRGNNRKKKGSANDDLISAMTASDPVPYKPVTQSSSLPTKPVSKGFPLKYGSSGVLVRKLQEALNKNFGLSIGVDGQFGPETKKALTRKGLPTSLDQPAFDKIVAKKTGESTSSKLTSAKAIKIISSSLKMSIAANDLNMAIKALRYIKSKNSYTKINNDFKKTAPIGHFVRKTIVVALLGQFTDSGDKRQLENEFRRIGLTKSGSKWTLSGLSGGELVTIRETKVWDENSRTLIVPKNTILGVFIDGANGVTEFETMDAKRLFTATDAIQFTMA